MLPRQAVFWNRKNPRPLHGIDILGHSWIRGKLWSHVRLRGVIPLYAFFVSRNVLASHAQRVSGRLIIV